MFPKMLTADKNKIGSNRVNPDKYLPKNMSKI